MTPPLFRAMTAYFPEPFGADEAVIRELADTSFWNTHPMAVIGGFDVVQVPTLGTREFSVFAMTLGLLAIVLLRRKRRRKESF